MDVETDALLDDTGELDGDEVVATMDEQTIANVSAILGDRASLRVAAIMAVLGEQQIVLAADDSIERTAQMLGIKGLVEADDEKEVARAGELVRLIAPNAEPVLVANVADAIVLALRGIDGDPAALDKLMPDEPTTHRAVCMVDGCPSAVTYRPTASGASFTIVSREGMDADASIGVGDGGRPICPIEDHGEMTLADETLPAADAFRLVAEKLAPVQGELPGVFPDFNWAGAGKDMADQALRVDAFRLSYEDAHEKAKRAKKAWDDAEELLTKMGVEYSRRARAKSEPDPVAITQSARLGPCAWSKDHPDDPCPLCSVSSIAEREAIVTVLGAELLPRDASGHANQVTTYRDRVDIDATLEALDGHLSDITREEVAGWTAEQRHAVRAWAANPDSTWEHIPEVFGRPHVAGPAGEQAQACQVCGSVLRTYDSAAEALPSGAHVRTDCAGAEPEGHRYPDTSKPKRQRKPREVAAEEPKPEAAQRARGTKKTSAPKHKSFPKPAAKKGKGRR